MHLKLLIAFHLLCLEDSLGIRGTGNPSLHVQRHRSVQEGVLVQLFALLSEFAQIVQLSYG